MLTKNLVMTTSHFAPTYESVDTNGTTLTMAIHVEGELLGKSGSATGLNQWT